MLDYYLILFYRNIDLNESSDSTAESWMCEPSILVPDVEYRWIVIAPNRKNIKGRII